MASAQPISQPSHRGAPVSNQFQQAVSPPSKEQLKSWWTKFGRKKDKPEEPAPANHGIFGVPLSQSILYANVAISLTNEEGESFIYGFVPIVVAKCGVFLKEKATDVEGIFRLSGSAKRIKDLQTIFNSPDRYGKGLDWTGYTVHDAANILRRYLNQLPEPIVPLEFYERFRDPLRAYQAKIGSDPHAQAMENEEHARAVVAYQKLITELPALNRQLLLYILDLLAVFASKSDMNRMTAQNLAAIFQPGIISHPAHDMAPNEYRLSQDVLIFLIENQDNFLIGMTGTAMDEKTKDEVKSGPPSVKTPKATIGRSASTASAGSVNARRSGGIRRNASLSSRNSRERSSPSVSNPGTPVSPSGLAAGAANTGSLGRSNTVPSNRSPAMSGHRFQRISDTSQPTAPDVNVPAAIPGSPPDEHASTRHTVNPAALNNTDVRLPPPEWATPSDRTTGVVEDNQIAEPAASVTAAQDLKPTRDPLNTSVADKPQGRERKISNLLAISPRFGPSDQQRDTNQRQPRKLQKRRIPGSSNESAQSSQASLPVDEGSGFHTPLMTPDHFQGANAAELQQGISNAVATPTTGDHLGEFPTPSSGSKEARQSGQTLMPPHGSPTPSLHSRGSATDPSDLDGLDDSAVRGEKRRHRWRFSKTEAGTLLPPPPIGQNAGARTSNSSLGSNRPRKSFTGDSQLTQSSNVDSTGQPSAMNMSSRESSDLVNAQLPEGEKKGGLFGRLKQWRENREAEKDRAKSPPRLQADQPNSRQSLSAFAHEHLSPRGRSFDRPRDEQIPTPYDKQGHERSLSKTPLAPGQPQGPVAAQGPGSMSAAAPGQPLVSAAPPSAPSAEVSDKDPTLNAAPSSGTGMTLLQAGVNVQDTQPMVEAVSPMELPEQVAYLHRPEVNTSEAAKQAGAGQENHAT